MAQLITVRLSRVDAQPWGLRLQGGKDFGTPLVVQKVNIGSIADQAGLIAGDSVIKVNNVDVFSLRHKDAQDIIVRSGNSFEITIQRGGSTWRPSVTPTGAIPSPTPSYGNQINTVTKTSLAHKQQESQHIGCGYNNAARPFQNGSEPVKSIVNKQYNTPVGIYSEESIAETLSAQAEVLAGGVLGVNFKKNEKVYNSAGSEVLKALQESENDPAEPAGTNFYWTASHAVGGAASSRSHTPSQFQGAAESNKNGNGKQEDVKSDVRNVVPVQPKPVTAKPIQAPVTAKPIQSPVVPKPEQSPKVSPCDECGSSIPGVFVRIKDKNLHVDCFKCATCGTSLKNQGYFNLNNKLYCDVHAKLAAVNNPPPGTEGYKPVPIGPNTKLSASTISAALSAHHGNLPHQNGTSHNNNHDYLLPNHSRTSSAASSFGSSYVSSTDSNKASPSTVSPVHSRQGSQNSTTSNLSLNYRQNADEIDKNVINASYHNNSTLPRYQSVFNAEIKGYYNDNNQKSSILDDINAKEMAIVDGGFNGKTSGHDESIYGTIRNTDEKGKESEDVIYRTMDGGVIRSVHPPGKGKGTKYQLPSNLGSPKPYSYGSGPPPAGPKSPSSYPPPNWSQPKQQAYAPPQQTYAPPQQTYAPPQQTYAPPQQTYAPPQQTYAPPQQTYAPPKPTYAPPQNYSSPASNFNNNNFGSNTLPRSVGQSAPGRYNTNTLKKPGYNYNQGPNKGLTFGATSAPKRGRGILSKGPGPGGRVPQCGCCNAQIRGPFITALGRIWCPDHFVCVSQSCRRPLADIGFVEEKGDLYCEYCFEKYLAPPCDKCGAKIKGDCLNAIGKHYHPECFVCTYCGKLFGNSPFFLEEGQAYCEADWNELFTTKCFACGFPVEAGDRWVEALSHNYHSQCFNCTMCKKNLEGQSFFAKGGRPYCKNHAR
ncbi:PDZ and LIM domain protein Zasp isoform X10 [Bradysia coprophila]|uniref:PDZ and LIM domain protein Zasp isoform X10 n=1 Tax=Bradysia coprophila TaxID=38358 RepID=UPI00187D903F|nr:PDZ and LIM domain protein Zasp isoform X10 [Bradysia coprophila]